MLPMSGKSLAWIINYTESAVRQLKKIDKQIALRILDYMDVRIAPLEDPRSAGKNLVGPKMGSYWRYRIGDMRIICDIRDRELTILVLLLGHRREVYQK